nr:hypothetical protein [Tanacetum cinerariifolium]
MSDTSSAFTYMSVYTDSEPWRYYGEESAEGGSPGVIVYGYDGLPMQPVAPPSPDYVPGPEHPPSPNYVPGPEHPPSPVEIPYVPEPEYPEYLVPYDAEAPLEDHPLPVDTSPTAASPGYVANSDPDEDPKEDPEDDHVDYHADRGDGDDETFDDDDDDDDTDDEDEEPFEDEDDDEEEEHLALADSSVVPIVDPVLSAGDTKALEADEPACITRHDALLSPPLLVPSPPLPLPSPLTTNPTDTRAPLGYMAARIRMRALLPSISRRTDIPEADVPPRKRACLTTPAPGFEVGRVLQLVLQGSQGLQTLTLGDTGDRPDHCRTAMLLDREAMYAHEVWAGSEDRSAAIAAHVRTLEAHVAALIAQTSSLQTQLTITLGRIEILEARDLEPQEGPTEAGSNLIGGRRQVTTQRECTYTDFLKCQPMSFQGTEGVVGLTRWLEKMESVFQISNCTVICQELALICDRMFFEESAKVERYIGGLSAMIHGSVREPQSMQEAIKFATEMMDKKMLTHVERQAKHKRKFNDTSKNNQHQHQPFKRYNVARVYTVGP